MADALPFAVVDRFSMNSTHWPLTPLGSPRESVFGRTILTP
jgi:hypothetical protein